MSNSPKSQLRPLGVILSKAKDLAHEGCDTLERKCAPTSCERFLARLGMTLRTTS